MNEIKPIQVLAISGSLRKESYNTAALRAAKELAPSGMNIEITSINSIPLYNPDLEKPIWPANVIDLVEQVISVDAILIATPEHNFSIPAALKSVLDWLSRNPPGEPQGWTAVAGKPLAILGASPGQMGTVRAQLHLRQIAASLDLRALNKPEVLISRVHEKVDASGELTDSPTKRIIGSLLEALLHECQNRDEPTTSNRTS